LLTNDLNIKYKKSKHVQKWIFFFLDYLHVQGQDQYNNPNKGNYLQHQTVYADGDTVTSFDKYQPG